MTGTYLEWELTLVWPGTFTAGSDVAFDYKQSRHDLQLAYSGVGGIAIRFAEWDGATLTYVIPGQVTEYTIAVPSSPVVIRLRADVNAGPHCWINGTEVTANLTGVSTGVDLFDVYGAAVVCTPPLGSTVPLHAPMPIDFHFTDPTGGIESDWAETDAASDWAETNVSYTSRDAQGWNGLIATVASGRVASRVFALRPFLPVTKARQADGRRYFAFPDVRGSKAYSTGSTWAASGSYFVEGQLAESLAGEAPSSFATDVDWYRGAIAYCPPSGVTSTLDGGGASLPGTTREVRADLQARYTYPVNRSLAAKVLSKPNTPDSVVASGLLTDPRDPDEDLIAPYMLARPDGQFECGWLAKGAQKSYVTGLDSPETWVADVDTTFADEHPYTADVERGRDGRVVICYFEASLAAVRVAWRLADGAAFGAPVDVVTGLTVGCWPVVIQADDGSWWVYTRISRAWHRYQADTPAGPWVEV